MSRKRSFKRVVFGGSPRTTICGYLLAGLLALQPVITDHELSSNDKIVTFGIAFLIAVLGRMSADNNQQVQLAEKQEVIESTEKDIPTQPVEKPKTVKKPIKKNQEK